MGDWLQALDLRRALQNIHQEYPGDWYRDPWGWPEADWCVDKRPDFVLSRLDSEDWKQPATIDVAKENFGVRPAVVLDPVDRLAYQSVVDSISTATIQHLPQWVYGWRLPFGTATENGHYARQDYHWENYRAALSRLSLAFDGALRTDITSFFASIPVDRLIERIEQRRRNDLTERLFSMLRFWSTAHQSRSGLIQRSTASAVLANLYLAPFDDVVREYGGARRATRWMDDLWLFSSLPIPGRQARLPTGAATRARCDAMKSGSLPALHGITSGTVTFSV